MKQVTNVKQEAYHVLAKLPDTATWDYLMHEIYVRQVHAKFGLSS